MNYANGNVTLGQRMKPTIGYYVSLISLGIGMSSLGATLPELAAHTGVNLQYISLLFTANSLGYIGGTLAGGFIYDRVPGHPVMVAVLVVMSAMMALIPLTTVLAVLIAILAVLGFAIGILDVGANTLIVWVHRDKVAPFMNALHFFFGVGAVLSPVVVDWILGLTSSGAEAVATAGAGAAAGPAAAAGTSLAAAAADSLTAGTAAAHAVTGDIRWAFWVLAVMILPAALWVMVTKSPDPLTAEEVRENGKVNDPVLIGLVAVLFLTFVGAELGFGGWINTYAVEGLGRESTMGRLLTSVFWASLAGARLLIVPISPFVKPRYILIAVVAGCVLSLGAISAWPGSDAALWVGTIGFGLCVGPMFPTALNMAERVTHLSGAVTSVFLVGGSVGSMTVPWIIGQFFESSGAWVMIAVLLGVMILSMSMLGAVLLRLRVASRR